jgi:hypothetical protein
MATLLQQLQAALDALNHGDVEPLVALFDPSLEWRGETSGRLWWSHTPA